MISPDLIAMLASHRANDVYVAVPDEYGGTLLRLAIDDVRYEPTTDQLLIITEIGYGRLIDDDDPTRTEGGAMTEVIP